MNDCESLEAIYRQATHPDNIQQAVSYLTSQRGLNYFGGLGFIQYAKFNGQTVANSITIPVFDATGKLVLLDCKNIQTGEYTKLTSPESHYTPIRNLSATVRHRIITEGVFNAESIQQCFPMSGLTISSTLRASMNAKTYHILAATTTETIITAFDNDAAGQEATQSLVDFMREHYPELDIDILEFPYNDLNEFLLRKGKAFFQKIIGQQLRQYTTSLSQDAS